MSDSPSLNALINQRLSRVRSPVILETHDANFRKYDRVRLHPAYGNQWDPFMCTIHSVSVKGIFAETEGRFSTLTAQLMEEANVFPGLAMSPRQQSRQGRNTSF